MRGLSPGNLNSMRRFAGAWANRASCLRVVGKIPWGHNQTLIDKLDTPELREWYAGQAVEFGWSRAVLEHHIVESAVADFERTSGSAPSTDRNQT
jgi:hypothetical protein